jgi:nephrocystin-4
VQVHVHWLNAHEVTAAIGQSNQSSIILRGLPSEGREVALFCSHAEELQLEPHTLRLPAATQVEVKLHFHPLATGSQDMVVSVVDCATGGLVDAMLIRTHARVPQVSRVFEVDLPVGTLVNKKVLACCSTLATARAALSAGRLR